MSKMRYTKDNPLRVFEAFAGYGSQSMALDRLKECYPDFDFKVVGISEIDEDAIRAYRAVHGDDIPNYGDISKIDWGGQMPDFDLFTYSFPCFSAGTIVITGRGLIPIEQVKVGDMVLTHKCNFERVIRTMSRIYEGDMVYINAMPIDEITCTPNHPFYIRRRYRKYYQRKSIRMFSSPEWVDAKNLTHDTYIGIAVNNKQEYPKWDGITDNRWGHNRQSNRLSPLFDRECFWYLMGRYVGDGWKRYDGSGIIICCGGRNEDLLKQKIHECGFSFTLSKEKTCNKYHICVKELNKFVERYGHLACNKKIDSDTLNLPIDMLKAFINGCMDSDGNRNGKYNVISSISRELIYGIAQCVAKVYKTPYRIYRSKRKEKTIIEGRIVKQRDSYQVLWKEEVCKQDKSFYEDGYIWCPLSKTTYMPSIIQVYNLEVENDNSYTANGIIVHNCTDISQAGKQEGFAEGSGTRSSLLWECKKAIEAKHPKYLLMENVKALMSGKFAPLLHVWQRWLEGQGYYNFARLLNAKDYGIPQNRERVFMVSILRTPDEAEPSYHFPKPFTLRKRMKDILETDVPENYFLSYNALEYFCRVNNDKSHGHDFTPKDEGGIAFTVRTRPGSRVDDNFIKHETD